MIEALDFDDPIWTRLNSADRALYDPRPALRRLREGDATVWDELFNKLHRQGDIGDAAFAAVPHLVDIHAERAAPEWKTFALSALIEHRRGVGGNPDVPAALEAPYEAAWPRLARLALQELPGAGASEAVRSLLAVLAFAKGERTIGLFAIDFTEDEREEILAPFL